VIRQGSERSCDLSTIIISGWPPYIKKNRLIDIKQPGSLGHENGYTQDMEQYRQMTPGKEETMRIYEDGIYRPPDMIEKPGGLHVKGSSIRDVRSCSLQAVPITQLWKLTRD